MSPPARVLLVEDHPIVRGGCRRLLEAQGTAEVVEASSGADGLRLAPGLGPGDVIVVDLNLPDIGGLDLIRRLLAARPEARILVFSMHEDPVFAARALQAGALGYVTKGDDPGVLLEAVDKVARGEVHLGHKVAQGLALMNLRPSAANPLTDLSPRELDILEHLGRGRSLAEVAVALGVSYRTAANIAATLRGKLNVGTNAGLVRFALEHGSARTGPR